MSPDSPDAPSGAAARVLLPNLGAEEGQDWHALEKLSAARLAARLWALLFAGSDIVRLPARGAPDRAVHCEAFWPAALGDVPNSPAFPWLETGAAHAWLNTETVADYAKKVLRTPLAGPPPEVAWPLSDKARTVEAAAELGLTPSSLASLITAFTPAECQDAEVLIPRLDAAIAEWPDWTEGRFTLKPRFGTSGRGRTGGVLTAETPAVRGALPRFADRGGAILEPWLARQTDLSVSLRVPHPNESEHQTTLLGTLETLTSPSGGYQGHCGEVDNRGRVFSAHPEDEALRGDAALLADKMREEGFFGPCGLDAFTYQQNLAPNGAHNERPRLRSVVEFNPRITMGIVTLGVIRRALPHVRERIDLTPGSRRGVLMTTFQPKNLDRLEAMRSRLGEGVVSLDLASEPSSLPERRRPLEPEAETPAEKPVLFFASDLQSLRGAYQEAMGC